MASEIVKYQPIVRAGEIQVGPTTIPIGQIRTSYSNPDTHVVTVITRGGMGVVEEDITFNFLLETAERVDQFVLDILTQKTVSVSLSDCPFASSNKESEDISEDLDRSEDPDYEIALDGRVKVQTESSLEPVTVFAEDVEANIKARMPSFIFHADLLIKITEGRFSKEMENCQAIYKRELNREHPKNPIETEILRNSILCLRSTLYQLSPEEGAAVLAKVPEEHAVGLQEILSMLEPDSSSSEE